VSRPVQLIVARVIALQSPDGLVALKPGIKVGDTFLVDIYSRCEFPVKNEAGAVGMADLVRDATDGGALPWHCLKLEV
jgi:hypothetical protein